MFPKIDNNIFFVTATDESGSDSDGGSSSSSFSSHSEQGPGDVKDHHDVIVTEYDNQDETCDPSLRLDHSVVHHPPTTLQVTLILDCSTNVTFVDPYYSPTCLKIKIKERG